MVAAAVPHVTPPLARSAREHFQPLYREPLSDEDGREIATNVLGAFAVLRDWRERRAQDAASPPPPPLRLTPKRRRRTATPTQE